jgi:hypothetical protein
MNTDSLRKLEEQLEKNLPTGDSLQQIKRFFEEAKQESVKNINRQLAKYAEISQMGKNLKTFCTLQFYQSPRVQQGLFIFRN